MMASGLLNALLLVVSLMWIAIWLVPIRPASTRERIDSEAATPAEHDDVTVLIPARDEAATLGAVLDGLAAQGRGLRIVVIDDQSSDATARIAARHATAPKVIAGNAPPPGWLGKAWALQQGLEQVATPYLLLLDADIALAAGMLSSLKNKLQNNDIYMVSVLARLQVEARAERWLVPAYVYFFKLLYPFALVNRRSGPVAGAAGGCGLAATTALRATGGFGPMRDAVIDDCALARQLKHAGYPIWLGLTNSARSLRPYPAFADIWNLVARSAFAQLRYSTAGLLACTAGLLTAFGAPLAGLVVLDGTARGVAAAGTLAMFGSYWPTLSFYQLKAWRSLSLPLVALAFLLMTWDSALRHWRGIGTTWKGRRYAPADLRSPG